MVFYLNNNLLLYWNNNWKSLQIIIQIKASNAIKASNEAKKVVQSIHAVRLSTQNSFFGLCRVECLAEAVLTLTELFTLFLPLQPTKQASNELLSAQKRFLHLQLLLINFLFSRLLWHTFRLVAKAQKLL